MCISWKNKRQIKTLDMGLDVPRHGVEGAGLDVHQNLG